MDRVNISSWLKSGQTFLPDLTRKLGIPNYGIVPTGKPQPLSEVASGGLWVTLEKAPEVVVGGLGQVSETVPQALRQHLGTDLRVLMPYLRPLKQSQPPFERTGVVTKLQGADGQVETFELLQQVVPGKPVVYAIANEKYFGRHDNLYFVNDKTDAELGKDACFKAVAMYNRAASELIPALDPQCADYQPTQAEPKAGGWKTLVDAASHLLPGHHNEPPPPPQEPLFSVELLKFPHRVDYVVAHDWLTAPILHQMDPAFGDKLAKVFYLHNTFNEVRSTHVAEKNGITVPPGEHHYSPLRVGIGTADVVIANQYYAQRLTQGLAGDADFVEPLRGKLQAGRVYDMHHGLSDVYRPTDNPILRADGYVDYTQEPDLARFKAHNQQALQREWGLRADADGVIFSWVARAEPFQKGFYMTMDALPRFMEEHPRSQLLMAGINLQKSPPHVVGWVEEMQKAYGDRVCFPGFVTNDKVVRIAAGSGFLMLPSLYEPYGLSQLEAMRVGTIPIVHGVDGLKATVADPSAEVPERLRPYGQTGICMEAVDVPRYWKALDGLVHHGKASDEHRAVLDAAAAKLRRALDRAMELHSQSPQQALQIRRNAMRFVEEQHNWREISQRYAPPLNAAMAAARHRQAGS